MSTNLACSNNEKYDNNINFLKARKEYITDNSLMSFEAPIFEEISEINEEKSITYNKTINLNDSRKEKNSSVNENVVSPELVKIEINMTSPTTNLQNTTATITTTTTTTTQNPIQCETINDSAQERVFTFKKSHTCGSLFAKCHCDDNVELSGNNQTSPQQIFTTNTDLHKDHLSVENRKFSSDNESVQYSINITTSSDKQQSNQGRSNSLDDSSLSRKKSDESQHNQCDAKTSRKSKSRKCSSNKSSITNNNNNDQQFPTFDHITVAKICKENPGVCLKHPEFPYPIPPSDWWYKHVDNVNKSVEIKSTTVSTSTQLVSSIVSSVTSTKKNSKPTATAIETNSSPLSLTQILQTRDYVPPFQEIFPKINIREGQLISRSNVNRQQCNSNETPDPAELYFKQSGIIGPVMMGNGASTTSGANAAGGATNCGRKSSKESISVVPSVTTIRKNSKILIETAVKKRSSQLSEDYDYLKTVVPHLRKEVHDWEEKAKNLELEILEIKQKLLRRDSEVIKLQREIHKLKSVLNQTILTQDTNNDILASLQEQHGMANRNYTSIHGTSFNNNCSTNSKKQGVSAESSQSNIGQQPSEIQIVRYEKDFRSKQLIKDAIMDNDFLKKLDSSQVRELVDSMYQKEYSVGSYVIREGEAGAHLFVSASGEFEVIKDNTVLGKMGPGKAFGELAILYNCTRTASIRVVVDSKVWVLDRRVFQQIMMRTGLQRLQDNINFLQSVPLLRNLNNDVLAKIADVLEVEFYPADAYIIRQGASGDTFFIISGGSVKVTQRIPGSSEEEEIRILQRGDYFGEQALLKEDCRTASVIALYPGVECLTLDRDSFIQLIGDLSELIEKDYGDERRVLSRPNSSVSVNSECQEFDHILLDDLDVIATLGVGGFGRVELVQYAYDRSQTFALKCLKKQHIVDTHQQEHVFSEKNIMMNCRNPFICKMYKTFKDKKYVYMLLEACLGGEVWTILKERSYFDDHTTRFITACVVEAFDYLHSKGIIYRDLKPENLLLDNRGYVKLVDFGFSKKIGFGTKTWTFCGTPEYVAPETILNKGHDRAVDYWALGILMHELLTGTPPFVASDPMKTYNIILKGIDMIDFPKHITRTAQSLIKRLCRDSPSERLGYQRGGIQDIKKHKWFQGFDWDGLKNRTMTPPIVQTVRGPCDTSNFECFSKDNDIPPDELSNWDADF